MTVVIVDIDRPEAEGVGKIEIIGRITEIWRDPHTAFPTAVEIEGVDLARTVSDMIGLERQEDFEVHLKLELRRKPEAVGGSEVRLDEAVPPNVILARSSAPPEPR